jgi:hypothetical protein
VRLGRVWVAVGEKREMDYVGVVWTSPDLVHWRTAALIYGDETASLGSAVADGGRVVAAGVEDASTSGQGYFASVWTGTP